MKDQLKLLIELQVHDAKIQELEATLKAFPAQFEAALSDVRKVEALLERERTQLAETEAWRKRQEQEARDQEDALIRAKQRSSMVKNVKEHMANERELETNRKNAQSREEEAKRLADAVANARKALAQHEADLAAMKAHVDEDQSAARGQMAAVEAQVAEAKKGREISAARVDPAALKRYSTIRMRRGMALSAVKNGTCQGCHMNIPPQLFNVLQRGQTIEVCPNCNRIIYWDRLLADPDGAPAEKSVAAKPEKVAKAPRAKAAPKPAPKVTPTPHVAAPPARPVTLAAPAGSEPGAMLSPPPASTVASSDEPESSKESTMNEPGDIDPHTERAEDDAAAPEHRSV